MSNSRIPSCREAPPPCGPASDPSGRPRGQVTTRQVAGMLERGEKAAFAACVRAVKDGSFPDNGLHGW